jgi:hydrogenase maturation factor
MLVRFVDRAQPMVLDRVSALRSLTMNLQVPGEQLSIAVRRPGGLDVTGVLAHLNRLQDN